MADVLGHVGRYGASSCTTPEASILNKGKVPNLTSFMLTLDRRGKRRGILLPATLNQNVLLIFGQTP